MGRETQESFYAPRSTFSRKLLLTLCLELALASAGSGSRGAEEGDGGGSMTKRAPERAGAGWAEGSSSLQELLMPTSVNTQ